MMPINNKYPGLILVTMLLTLAISCSKDGTTKNNTLNTEPIIDIAAAWSSDDLRIAYQHNDYVSQANNGIYVLNVSERTSRQIDTFASNCSWSLSANEIVYNKHLNPNIFTKDMLSLNPIQLTNTDIFKYNPYWRSDSVLYYLVFNGGQDQWGIWSYNLTSEQYSHVLNSGVTSYIVCPNSDSIIYVRDYTDLLLFDESSGTSTLLISAQDLNVTRIESPSAHPHDPIVAFCSLPYKDSDYTVWVFNYSTNTLTDFIEHAAWPSYSASGNYIVFTRVALYSMTIEGHGYLWSYLINEDSYIQLTR